MESLMRNGIFHVAPLLVVTTLLAACSANNRTATPQLGAVTRVSETTGVGAAPMVALSNNGERAIAWISAPDSGADGRLYISVGGAAPVGVTDPLAPMEVHGESPPKLAFAPDGALYAVYLLGKDVGKRFPVSALRVVRSSDNGHTWSSPITVTDDTAQFGSHNFHALTVAPDGTVYVSWLDGRTGKSGAYVTHSTDGGRTWAPNVRMSVGETCPCCRTALAAGPHGVIYAAWRSVIDGDVRDIVLARSEDDGVTWTTPHRVHADDWHINGCPHAGPSIQMDAQGNLHALWWTGKKGAAGVYYAVSKDSGRTFSDPVTISAQKIPLPSHVQLAVTKKGTVVAAWDETRGTRPVVFIRAATPGQRFSDAVQLTDSTVTSQYPVIGMHSDTAYVAWSATGAAPPPHAMGKMAPEAKMTLEPVGATQVMMRTVRM
jgi:hypothetical protein